ncbi:MAG: DUF92 domain-containing protein [Candidatus Norongarragalinales archaeon]
MAFEQINVLVGLIVSLLLAIYAFKKRELTDGGTVAAWFIGVSVFAFGGWTWLTLLVLFFLSSALLTRYKEKMKQNAYSEFAKGGTRDFWQVVANGALPALVAVGYFLDPKPELFAAYTAVIATATADTWATELGVLSKKTWLITTFRQVKAGLSGAVSVRGLLVSLAGAFFIALAAVLLNVLNNSVELALLGPLFFDQFVGGGRFLLLITFAGFAGSLADSLLGATVQANFYCAKCRAETEKTVHKCGTKTKLVRGFRQIDNDSVNFFSTFAGGAIAFALAAALL